MELHDDSVVKLSPNYKSIWDSLPNNYKTDADTKEIVGYLHKKKSANIEEISKRVFYTSDTYRYKLVINALIRVNLLIPVAQRASSKIILSKDIKNSSSLLREKNIPERDILDFINGIASGNIDTISNEVKTSISKLLDISPNIPNEPNRPPKSPKTPFDIDKFEAGLTSVGFIGDEDVLLSALRKIIRGNTLSLEPNEIDNIEKLAKTLTE